MILLVFIPERVIVYLRTHTEYSYWHRGIHDTDATRDRTGPTARPKSDGDASRLASRVRVRPRVTSRLCDVTSRVTESENRLHICDEL
jgi:hypothetical protein